MNVRELKNLINYVEQDSNYVEFHTVPINDMSCKNIPLPRSAHAYELVTQIEEG